MALNCEKCLKDVSLLTAVKVPSEGASVLKQLMVCEDCGKKFDWYCAVCNKWHPAAMKSYQCSIGGLVCEEKSTKNEREGKWWCQGCQTYHAKEYQCYIGGLHVNGKTGDYLDKDYAEAAMEAEDILTAAEEAEIKAWNDYKASGWKGMAPKYPSAWQAKQKGLFKETTYEKHNHKPQLVIDYEGLKVYAGTKWDSEPYFKDMDIVANCTGFRTREFRADGPHELCGILKKYEHYSSKPKPKFEEIVLDWPDYGAIDLPVEFWKDLVIEVKSRGGKLLCCCVGGHGRTGTAICAIMITHLGYTAKDAIEWVRTNYCKRAVESVSQEEYLGSLEPQKKGKKHAKHNRTV